MFYNGFGLITFKRNFYVYKKSLPRTVECTSGFQVTEYNSEEDSGLNLPLLLQEPRTSNSEPSKRKRWTYGCHQKLTKEPEIN